MTSTIVVGVDGSDPSARAVNWCADLAARVGAKVVVVHVLDLPVYPEQPPSGMSRPTLSPAERDELRDFIAREWCKPLADAGIEHRIALMGGHPPDALMDAARDQNADLVVTGRRGRGGFAELLLGSTSHKLTHQCDRPLVIVP
jgi:nucleotide-binding universal stress UspA family protein